MKAEEKLLELCSGINFQLVNGNESLEECRTKLRCNEEHYGMVAARGEAYKQRFLDLLSLLLAEKLNPLAMEKFGNTGESSLRRIFEEVDRGAEAVSDSGKVKQLALAALRADGLDESQIAALGRIIDSLPGMVVDALVELAGRLKVVPMPDYSGIAGTLAMMMKEVDDANDTGNT